MVVLVDSCKRLHQGINRLHEPGQKDVLGRGWLQMSADHVHSGRKFMTLKSTFTAIAAALVLMSAFAPPTAAQLTSASVSGTAKDAQGGVIPGATLKLISETLGVQTADVFTNEYGDFV